MPHPDAVTVRTPGYVLREHEFEIPLDHAGDPGRTITVFAREVADADDRDLPYLVFFQGGPGFESPRPGAGSPGWLTRALRDHRVLLLDQRGTGRSTPVSPSIAATGTPEQVADHLALFRADSIVADAEVIRQAMGIDRWSVLGQSFGGFCVLHYLSVAPDSLRAAYITGGVPPLGRSVDEVYTATYARQRERNRRYYERYPADRARVRDLVRRLDDDPLPLPTGDRLTGRRFRLHGNWLGMSDGADRLHNLVELPHDSAAFAHDASTGLGLARNPLYALVHEACYADGGTTGWSAERVMPGEFVDDVTLLTGEHLFPWVFEDIGALAPLAPAAELLAARDWPRLYDEDVLRRNEVPVAAAVYADDPYVESVFSMQTAAVVRGMKPWLTNEYDHNALRADGDRVLGRLIDLAAGRV